MSKVDTLAVMTAQVYTASYSYMRQKFDIKMEVAAQVARLLYEAAEKEAAKDPQPK
jgi:hypothetical protein